MNIHKLNSGDLILFRNINPGTAAIAVFLALKDEELPFWANLIVFVDGKIECLNYDVEFDELILLHHFKDVL